MKALHIVAAVAAGWALAAGCARQDVPPSSPAAPTSATGSPAVVGVTSSARPEAPQVARWGADAGAASNEPRDAGSPPAEPSDGGSEGRAARPSPADAGSDRPPPMTDPSRSGTWPRDAGVGRIDSTGGQPKPPSISLPDAGASPL